MYDDVGGKSFNEKTGAPLCRAQHPAMVSFPWASVRIFAPFTFALPCHMPYLYALTSNHPYFFLLVTPLPKAYFCADCVFYPRGVPWTKGTHGMSLSISSGIWFCIFSSIVNKFMKAQDLIRSSWMFSDPVLPFRREDMRIGPHPAMPHRPDGGTGLSRHNHRQRNSPG